MEPVLYEILYHADIDDLHHLCYINKQTMNICNDKHFWLEKFRHHNLPIINIGNNIEEWINEFVAIDRAARDTDETMKFLLVKGTYNKISYYITNFNSYTDIPFLPPKLIFNIKKELERLPKYNQPYQIIVSKREIIYVIKHEKYDHVNAAYSISTVTESVDFLFNFYYYYYKNHISIQLGEKYSDL
jgi:hypothetical protein